MATKPPTNLKERIAALQQRSTSNTTSPPTSPTTSAAPTVANTAQTVGTLKDKIARFERKGGVPVPRGSFGLGAAPAAEGPRRQGELYGNRIQAPGRLTPHYTGGSLASIGSFANSSQRRSCSASILTGNFDDNYLDYTPISSPTSVALPLSPDLTGNSPEVSPSRSTNGDIPAVTRNATRGTSFHEALEFARKVEAAKKEASIPPVKKKSADEQTIENSTAVKPVIGEAGELLEPTPAIFVSSDDLVADESASPVVGGLPMQSLSMPDSPVEPLVLEAKVEEPLVDGPEMTRDLEATSIVSDKQIAMTADSVKGQSTSEINDASAQVPALSSQSSTSIPVAEVAETQLSLPLPSRLEVYPSDTHERGRNTESKLGESDSTATQTPQCTRNDAQPAPILTGSFKVKFNAVESKVLDDRKGLSVDTGALVAAPKDVDSSVSTNSVPIAASAPATDEVDEPPPRTRSQIPALRVRPTIQPPDSPSFLSPLNGFRSAPVSSGASPSSLSSASSLPVSATEMTPGEVSRALKMTPATSRGIPVFLPPSNPQVRKTDFVYLPSSPVDNANTGPGLDVEEPSIVSVGHHKAGSESDLAFKSVVHGKVKETPASATLAMKRQVMPQTPVKNIKRATILQNPLSPGQGELAALLQEAMLLEDTLNKGELPGEPTKDEPVTAGADVSGTTISAAQLKEEERQRITQTNVQLRSKRDMPTHGRLKHTFLMPLSKARASQKQEASTPVEQAAPRSSRDDSRQKSAAFDNVGSKDVIQEKSPSSATPSSPSKIPKLSKFPSFKRFGSISRTVSQQEALLRHSYSTSSEISSEDSNLIVTPPDNVMEFGERKPTKDVDQQSVQSQTLSFSFPSLSPKKAGSIASFAEKMWSRTRTKSNGSAFSSTSGIPHQSNEELTPQLPVLSELPSIPSLSSIVPPLTEIDSVLHRPASGSSLRNRVDFSGPSKTVPILSVPYIDTTNQPLSAMSMSSIGSLPSPLFDKDICDAFPSVPTDTPQLSNRYFPRGRGQGLTAAATAATADFDSALLSSAIHLAARNKASAS